MGVRSNRGRCSEKDRHQFSVCIADILGDVDAVHRHDRGAFVYYGGTVSDDTTFFAWMPEEQTISAIATLTDENRSLRAHLATAREKAAKDSTALYAELLVLKDSCDAAHETIRQLHASLLAQAEQLTARDASIAGLNAANLQLVQRLSVANNTIAAKDGRIAELDTRLARR